MHRAARRLLTLLLGTALAAGSLTLVAAPAQAVPVPPPAGGTVVAWGGNSDLATVPAALATKKVVAVASSGLFSLALTEDGAVTAWGYNMSGQLDVPAALATKKVTAIAAGGNHSLALTEDGTVTAWGSNTEGQTNVPASLAGKRVTSVSAGYAHSLALVDDGTVVAWGNSAAGITNVPASLTGKRVTAISAGQHFSLALTSDGTVTAWGDDVNGESNVPTSLTGKRVTAISAGANHSLALTDDGAVTAWGYDGRGQASVPASLAGKRVTAIAAGQQHSLALTDDDIVTGWGLDSAGQATAPASLAGKRVIAVTASVAHSLAIVTDPPTVTTGLAGDTTTIRAGEAVALTIGATGAELQSALLWRQGHSAGTFAGAGGSWTISGLTVPGTYAYRVEALTDRGMLTTTVTVVVTPAAVATLHVAAPATATYGDTVSVTATGTDRFANPTGDETGRVTVASSDPSDTVSGTDVTVGSAGPRTLTVTHTPTGVTATRTVTVSLDAFTTPPAPGISGVVQVGETLTADAGAVAPTPDSLAYQWLADDREITGATRSELTLAPEHVGARISVRVTARLAGHADATGTSASTAAVAPVDAPPVTPPVVVAPTLDLSVAKQQLRRGQSTTLRWTATGAERVVASGDWTGTQPATGRVTVKPALGTTVYRLAATNRAGTTTAQVSVTVTRQATGLRVTTTAKPVVRSSRTRVTVRGLDAREPYAVAIGGRTVARGTADARGGASRTVTVPRMRPTARLAVTVTGAEADRTGRASLAVVTGKLTATTRKPAARASTAQLVTVRGLVPGQKVRVTYRGERVSVASARASRNGTYRVRFDVGQRWGTKKVTVRSGGRTTQVRFAVTPYRG